MPSPRSHSPRTAAFSSLAQDPRLSIIAEDGDVPVAEPGAPPVPPRSTHRPFTRRWRDAPPRPSADRPPPLYTVWDNGPESSQEKLNRGRRRKAFATKRGGWRRLILIIIAMLAVVIALAVGLGVGLTQRKNDGAGNAAATSSPVPTAGPSQFPAGSYQFMTYLDQVRTDCTANPATFRCYPYTNYATNANLSSASFLWVITETSTGSFVISSSDNPFGLAFSNVTLTLQDANTDNERYSYTLPLNKLVLPSSSITSDGSAAECFFNGTVLSADMYTRKPNMSGNNSNSTSSDSGQIWQVWQTAVSINQTISGGQDVPACYEGITGTSGTRITSGLAPQPTTSQCGCFYRNYNL